MLDFKFKKEHILVVLLLSGILIPPFVKPLYSLPIVLGIGFFLIREKFDTIKFTLLDVGILILLLNEIITALFSSYPFNSLSSITRMFIISCSYLLFKFFLNKGQNKLIFLMFIFVLSSVVLILTTSYFKDFAAIVHENGFKNISDFKNLYSPLGKVSNIWGAFLLLTLPFNLILLLNLKKNEDKLLIFLNVALNIFSLIITFSRGVYISLLLFILATILVYFVYLKLKQSLTLSFVGILILIASAIIVKDSFLTTVGFNKTISQQRSTEGRVILWKHSLEQLKEKPIFGFGQENYKISNESKPLVAEDVVFNNRTNNTYIQLLIERGIFGLLCYFLFFLILVKIIWNSLKSKTVNSKDKIQLLIISIGLISFLLREFTFSSFFESSYVNYIAFHLIFLLIPFDISLKEVQFTQVHKKIFSYIFAFLFLIVLGLNIKRHFVSKLNSQFIQAYNEDRIKLSIETIDKALLLSKNNLTLIKHKALAFSKNNLSINISAKNQNLMTISVENLDSLNMGKDILQKVLLSHPKDHEAMHNLGWISMAVGDFTNAEKNFKNSLRYNPYLVEYGASLVLCKIVQSKIDEAIEPLSKIVQYSPDVLESTFYLELEKKYSSIAKKAKLKAASELKNKLKVNENNPIYMARLARVLLNDDKAEAEKLLQRVNEILPNLNRPRLYLGYLKSLENDSIAAKDFFTKAKYLEPRDYLNHLYEGNFQKKVASEEKAIKNYEELFGMYNSLRSSSSFSSNASWARLNFLRNSLIPKELLFYIKPKINAKEILNYLEKYYRKKDNKEKADIYKLALEKYTNEFFTGELN